MSTRDRWWSNCSLYTSGNPLASANSLYPDDFHPFDDVQLHRVLDDAAEPTEWVTIEGFRDGGTRDVRVRYQDLLDQADGHLRDLHAKTLDDPMSFREFAHATARAAIGFLMD